MNLIQTKNALALIFNEQKVFVHNKDIPFLNAIQEKGNKNEVLPLVNYTIKEHSTNRIVIEFFDKTSCSVTIEENDDKITLQFSSTEKCIRIRLHCTETETLYFDDVVLNGRIFIKSEKEKVIHSNLSFLGKTFQLDRTEVVYKKHLPTKLKSSTGISIVLDDEPLQINAEDSLCMEITAQCPCKITLQ